MHAGTWEGRQGGLLGPAGEGVSEGDSCIFGGKQRRDGGFPSKSAPKCLCFGPRCWLGSSPEREKPEAGLPAQPQAPWRSAKPAALCGRRVCAEGEARPQPRTTHNSAHSRLSFVPSLLPEEAPAMAGPSGAGPRRAGGCVSEHHAVSSPRGPATPGRALSPGQRVSAPVGSALPLSECAPCRGAGGWRDRGHPHPRCPMFRVARSRASRPEGVSLGPGPA